MAPTATQPERPWQCVSGEKPPIYKTWNTATETTTANTDKQASSPSIKKSVKEQVSTRSIASSWSSQDWNNVILLTVVAIAVRLFIIYHPSLVIFDEVHFGGFASNYLNRQYYTDVHPPLAKLLVAFTGWLGALDLDFKFKNIGIDYNEGHVPFIFMRLVPALLGTAMVPLAYVTLRAFQLRRTPSVWTSALILFENAFTTQFRFILLDAYLAFGTAAAVAAYALFRERREHPFSPSWWLFLVGTGFWLGFTLSCKWVGLFTVATVGLFTALDVWNMIADRRIPLSKWGLQFAARLACLAGIPILVYMLSFQIHFMVLSKYGLSGGQMSVEFQQGFSDRPHTEPTFLDVGYGSIVNIRHQVRKTSFLHSHNHFYPSGSKQQQVTMYDFSDENSQWRILHSRTHDKIALNNVTQFIPLRHHDIIRLEHVATGRFLHSHGVEPPLSDKEHHFEVSCYGEVASNIGDTNDHWRIELTDEHGQPLSPHQVAAAQDDMSRERHSKAAFASLVLAKKKQNVAANPDASVAESEEQVVEVEKEEEEGVQRYARVLARQSYFQLVHVNTGARLSTFGKKLPSWAFEQGEVTSSRDAVKRNTVWLIDSNTHPLLSGDAPRVDYRGLSFFEKFIELNRLMWNMNSGLTDSHYFGSRPDSWFTLRRGLGFWNGAQQGSRRNVSVEHEQLDDGTLLMHSTWEPGSYTESHELKSRNKGSQIYLIGNPVTWWLTSATLLLYATLVVCLVLVERRGFSKLPSDSEYRIMRSAGFLFFGWALHYFPFFFDEAAAVSAPLLACLLFWHHAHGLLDTWIFESHFERGQSLYEKAGSL